MIFSDTWPEWSASFGRGHPRGQERTSETVKLHGWSLPGLGSMRSGGVITVTVTITAAVGEDILWALCHFEPFRCPFSLVCMMT